MTIEEILSMTPQEKRIKIAEFDNWENVHLAGSKTISEPLLDKGLGLVGFLNGKMQLEIVPDYLNDLNAMHEVEKVLTFEQQRIYGDILGLHVGNWYRMHVTAVQRANAFLLTMITEGD